MAQAKPAITLAFTGASGAGYGLRLLQQLLSQGYPVYLMISSAARVVFKTEEGLGLSAKPEQATEQLIQALGCGEGLLKVFGKEDWFSPVASGSSAPKCMVICPCSTGTLAAVATGMSNNLIERAADVVLKERGTLILAPRETPLHATHLEHMLSLTRQGAVVMPLAPGFYSEPQSIQDLIDFMVARILEHLNVPQTLMAPWGYQKPSK
ncbi:flavin prenyltransferase UbiX [Paraferrimonas sedimenticola]|uniref:Flavin prenyltransferase UbiX n=1 Tax=Paraferrimonas sedimenticola TaxID=375674 RepID=A0AA37RVG6_9GAMM|nr:flavin prenyltransferase UbiX [Paraferrimonas sedimenticola]GLP95639.1 flavin prenyltransferase UbiX [Paraferrimonas sedimenticola]